MNRGQTRVDRVVVRPDGCWHYGTQNKDGNYASAYAGTKQRAHRFVYETLVGPIPDGHELHHRCRNRWCVNVGHLIPVTRTEHFRIETRSGLERVYQAKREKDVCKNGHRYADGNEYRPPGRGNRMCRACNREAQRRYAGRQQVG